jgi:hypothetical protein
MNNNLKQKIKNINPNILTKRYAWEIEATFPSEKGKEPLLIHQTLQRKIPCDQLCVLITNSDQINNEKIIYTTFLEIYSEIKINYTLDSFFEKFFKIKETINKDQKVDQFINNLINNEFKKSFKIKEIINPEKERNQIIYKIIKDDFDGSIHSPFLVTDVSKQILPVERYIRKIFFHFYNKKTKNISEKGAMELYSGLIGYYPQDLLHHSDKILEIIRLTEKEFKNFLLN